MKDGNWNGYVYEHIVVAENQIKRRLQKNEVVHHLDFDRLNNRSENLLVIDRGQHSKLHIWLDKGAPGWERPGENWVNSKKPKFCSYCDITLQGKQQKYCSIACNSRSQRRIDRPTYEQLMQDVDFMTMEAIGTKYNVSSNAVRKWIKQYEQNMVTLSQAEDTSSEGAETSGEVKSS